MHRAWTTFAMSHDLDRFKKIYLDEFGEHLSDEDAERKARLVLNLYLAVYRSPREVIKEAESTLIEQHHEK